MYHRGGAISFLYTSSYSCASSAPCSLCNSKRWHTYSATFDCSFVDFSIFFVLFDNFALFAFFLVVFAIFFAIPFLTKKYLGLK